MKKFGINHKYFMMAATCTFAMGALGCGPGGPGTPNPGPPAPKFLDAIEICATVTKDTSTPLSYANVWFELRGRNEAKGAPIVYPPAGQTQGADVQLDADGKLTPAPSAYPCFRVDFGAASDYDTNFDIKHPELFVHTDQAGYLKMEAVDSVQSADAVEDPAPTTQPVAILGADGGILTSPTVYLWRVFVTFDMAKGTTTGTAAIDKFIIKQAAKGAVDTLKYRLEKALSLKDDSEAGLKNAPGTEGQQPSREAVSKNVVL